MDSYYLDSDPPGKLVGVWYALEDIHPDSGCFYVCPKSHLISETLFMDLNHEEYVHAMLEYVKKNNIQKLDCPLQKGDVLFWNSLTLHGAHSNVNPKFSRKSFTSHFIPVGAKRNNETVPVLQDSWTNGIKIRKRNALKDRLRYFKVLSKYVFKTRMSKKVDMEMKSEKY